MRWLLILAMLTPAVASAQATFNGMTFWPVPSDNIIINRASDLPKSDDPALDAAITVCGSHSFLHYDNVDGSRPKFEFYPRPDGTVSPFEAPCQQVINRWRRAIAAKDKKLQDEQTKIQQQADQKDLDAVNRYLKTAP